VQGFPVQCGPVFLNYERIPADCSVPMHAVGKEEFVPAHKQPKRVISQNRRRRWGGSLGKNGVPPPFGA